MSAGCSRRGRSPTAGMSSKRKKLDESDDEDSNESTVSSQEESLPPRTPSPEPDENTEKLPEELLRSFYKSSGVLMIAGLVSWDQVARREHNHTKRTHPNLYTFHKFTDMRFRLIVSGCTAGHSVLVSEEGVAHTFGRNTCGQLGFGDNLTRHVPEPIPTLEGRNIIHAAAGRNHTLFVTDTGTVYSCGDNKNGQCGIGVVTPQVLRPTRIKYTGTPVVKVACGADFSMILDCEGVLHSFGMPEHGQLGHNTDGKYFLTANKLSYHYELTPKAITGYVQKAKDGHLNPVKDVTIVDISCGTNHSVAIDTKKRAYSWGFGGFGRLGHAEQKDECVPRMIKYFDSVSRGVRSVHCGGTFSLAINDQGALFMFGQNKRTGEANMYPKPVHDLIGWNIKSIGTSNTSIVIAADDSIIAWGVSPTYGELGMGEINKSSAKPKEVSRMEGLAITQVAMGFSHTLLICDDTNETVKQKLGTIPGFEP